MQDAVLKIQKLGVPPEGFEDSGFVDDEDSPDEDTLSLWDDWVDAVDSIKRPITYEEAEILIKCAPTEPMAEVEWTFLHCIESCITGLDLLKEADLEKYKSLIEKCNSDMMKEMLSKRLENYLAKRR